MNKKIIALAVAGALAAPMAQAEVTVSGVLQAEIVSLGGDYDGIYMVDGSANAGEGSGVGALNFTASEDLGGGLTAIAKYSLNINADDGTQGDRDSYVGLTGGFGTVLAGRLSTPYKSSTVKWDPFVATSLQARCNAGASCGALGHTSYLNNALAYANKFGSSKVVAAVVIDESANENHAFSASLNMPVGPVELAVAYLDASEFNYDGVTVPVPAGAVADDATEFKVGVKYAAGDLGVSLQYEDRDTGLGDETFLLVNGTYAMGANTFAIGYGINDYTADEDTYLALGMMHAFSKTTRGHIGYRTTTRTNVGGVAGNDLDENIIAAGLRVAF